MAVMPSTGLPKVSGRRCRPVGEHRRKLARFRYPIQAKTSKPLQLGLLANMFVDVLLEGVASSSAGQCLLYWRCTAWFVSATAFPCFSVGSDVAASPLLPVCSI